MRVSRRSRVSAFALRATADKSLRSPGLRTEYDFVISRHNAPELCFVCPPKWEGAGKTGCTLHPRSRVQFAHKNAHTSIQVQAEHPGLPCAMALRLTSCSPRRTAFLPPSPREKLSLLPDLAPAPRRPNHTTSPYASGAYVYRAFASIASHR